VGESGEGGGLGFDGGTTRLLIVSGAVTAVPLLLFTAAARACLIRCSASSNISPRRMQFLLAVLVFGERLTTAHIICFGAIWTALAISRWTAGAGRGRRRRAAEGLPERPKRVAILLAMSRTSESTPISPSRADFASGDP
jgi:chloramphenicol-sensitive protein RarD